MDMHTGNASVSASVISTMMLADTVKGMKMRSLQDAQQALEAVEAGQVSAADLGPTAFLTVQAAKAEKQLNDMKARYIRDAMNPGGVPSGQPIMIGDQTDPIGHLISQVAYVEPQVHEKKYVPIRYPVLMPVSTEASEWARTITYFAGDMIGQAGWFSGDSQDMPYATEDREKKDVTVEMIALGYQYNLEEINQALMVPGLNLTFRKASAARFLMERFLDNIFLFGDSDKGFEGLFNSSNVTASNAAAVGGSGNDEEEWSSKTADEIIADVNSGISGVYTDTQTVEMADTMLIPPSEYSRLAGMHLPDTGISVLDWIARSNVYTASTGNRLTIRGIPGLENAAASNAGRAVFYKNDEDILVAHMPMPHTFLPVWQKGPLIFEVPAIARTGGLEIRRPDGVRYIDMITT